MGILDFIEIELTDKLIRRGLCLNILQKELVSHSSLNDYVLIYVPVRYGYNTSNPDL